MQTLRILPTLAVTVVTLGGMLLLPASPAQAAGSCQTIAYEPVTEAIGPIGEIIGSATDICDFLASHAISSRLYISPIAGLSGPVGSLGGAAGRKEQVDTAVDGVSAIAACHASTYYTAGLGTNIGFETIPPYSLDESAPVQIACLLKILPDRES